MKIIQNILQKTKASKLLLSMVVVFLVILNVSSVEAKSLKKGDEFIGNSDGILVIRIISSDEVELDTEKKETLLGKYTIDGERVRVVFGFFGTTMVQYYKITPDGLVEKKSGKIYYTKAAVAANDVALLKGYIGTWTDKDSYYFVEISYAGNSIRIRQTSGAPATDGAEFLGKYSEGGIIVVGDRKNFYKYQLPTFKLLENGELLHDCGECGSEDKLKKTAKKMPKVKYSKYSHPVNSD